MDPWPKFPANEGYTTKKIENMTGSHVLMLCMQHWPHLNDVVCSTYHANSKPCIRVRPAKKGLGAKAKPASEKVGKKGASGNVPKPCLKGFLLSADHTYLQGPPGDLRRRPRHRCVRSALLEKLERPNDASEGQEERRCGRRLAAGVQGDCLAVAIDDRRAAATPFCARRSLVGYWV
jgi:hypothetical protein